MRAKPAFYNEIRTKIRILSILQKYILREWSWTSLAVSIVLIVVFLGAFLGDMLNDIADGRMPAGLISMQLLMHLPESLGNILPLAGFVAVMWGLGRFYRDQEMAVMRSSGFGWKQLLKPLLTLVLPLAVTLLILGMVLAPAAAQMAEKQLEQAFRSAGRRGLDRDRSAQTWTATLRLRLCPVSRPLGRYVLQTRFALHLF